MSVEEGEGKGKKMQGAFSYLQLDYNSTENLLIDYSEMGRLFFPICHLQKVELR